MKARIISILILAAPLVLICQPTIDQKYDFLLTEYKALQKINTSLALEMSNQAAIYDLQMERAAVSNALVIHAIEQQHARRQKAIFIAAEVVAIASFITGFLTAKK